MTKFLICPICKNIVEVIEDNNGVISCCGKPMQEIVANNTEAATEKHIPVVEIKDNLVTIKVGSTLHPMEENHYIAWVYILTSKGAYRFDLKPSDEPTITKVLDNEERIVNVYAYCNLHGLWSNK